MDYNFYTNITEGKENKGPVVGDPYFLQTKEEIINWLNQYSVKNYEINEDLTIDVNGMVSLSYRELKSIPLKFGKVKSSFSCYSNEIISLKGCPDYVGGNFDCSNNKLKSLEYCPKTVGGDFNCSNNQLASLKGCPDKVNKLYCYNNKLTSFEYFPYVKDEFKIEDNKFSSVSGLANMSFDLLATLYSDYRGLNWKEIKWDKINNMDEIIAEIYEIIEKGHSVNYLQRLLKKLEESGAY